MLWDIWVIINRLGAQISRAWGTPRSSVKPPLQIKWSVSQRKQSPSEDVSLRMSHSRRVSLILLHQLLLWAAQQSHCEPQCMMGTSCLVSYMFSQSSNCSRCSSFPCSGPRSVLFMSFWCCLLFFALPLSGFFVPHRNEIQQQSNEQTHVIRLAQIDSDRQRSVRGRVSQLNVSAKVSESFCFLSPDWFTADRSQQVRMPKCPGRHGNHRLFNVMWRQREDLVRARVCVCLLSPSSYLWHTLCW